MSYWTNRQEQLKKEMEKDEIRLKERLSSFYNSELKSLEKEIAAYYQQYGKNNVIEYRKLLEKLPEEDKRLLIERMDAFAEKYPQYAHLMPVRASIYKLNRLEGLQYSIYMTQANIAGYTDAQAAEYLTKLSRKSMNTAMETLGFGKNFYAINSDAAKQFVNTPWSNGENFSTRIWGNTQKLANYLNQDIAQAFARGDSYERIVRNLRARFSRVNRNDAYRLIYTEGTYVMAEASMHPFTEDFAQYKISTVGDGKVCPICRAMAKKIFEIDNRQPGTNFPPFHPWCRCTFEIVVEDWSAWMDNYEKTHTKKETKTVENRLRGNTQRAILTVHKSLGAAAKRYDVKLAEGNGHTKLAEGQKIEGKIFAGKGTNVEIRDRFRLERDYHIPADEWKKVSGKGYIIKNGKRVLAELHWYEADGEIYEMKVKRYLDES